MNFIQRNPDDPKHAEFHDGEYEFWPTSGSVKGKSISIPAAVVSGLELLAATAAAGLLALAVSAMYVSSAPRTITMDSAVINAEVYNNVSDDMVAYSLSLNADPGVIYQEGVLDDDSDTLFLQNLSSGTTYLLQYYDEENKEIGEFRFTTPGDQPEGGPPAPQTPQPEQQPQEPLLPAEDPVIPAPEEENPVSPETEPTEETKPGPAPQTPPVIVRPTPDVPEEDPGPAPKPTPKPTPTPKPGPELAEDPVRLVEYIQPISGSVEGAYFSCAQVHTFQNVSGTYNLAVVQNGVQLGSGEYTVIPGEDSLTVEILDTVMPGQTVDTTVTVETSAGIVHSDTRIAPPSLDSVVMTAEKLENGYRFHITANVSPDDADDMTCRAELFINSGGKIDVSMAKGSGNTYVGTYDALGLTGSGTADVYVYGSCQNYLNYNPVVTIPTVLPYGP